MPDIKRYGIAGATMATILLTGQVMQMSTTNESEKVAQIQAMALPVEISDIKLTASDNTGAEPVVTAMLTEGSASQRPSPLETPSVAEACEITMRAEAKAAALVALDIKAPCLPNERVVIHHNGMMFAEVTDSKGALDVTVPALAEAAVFIASFASGDGTVANATVDTLKLFDRAAVQTQGTDGVSLHARENASKYGGKGHIWNGHAGSIADAVTGDGGFLIQLGDSSLQNPMTAEIYTYPTALAKGTDEVIMSVDIEITHQNCAQDIEAQTLQTNQAERVKVQNLDMSMPDCSVVGDFLVLNNLVNNLKVASN